MDNVLLQSQETLLDASNGSSDVFLFVVNCIIGTLSSFSCFVFTVLNFGFYGFCSLIFRCFKAVHLMFQIFDTSLEFLKSLLQLNYSLVTRGLDSGVQIVTTSYSCLQSFIAAIFKFILDIPFACLSFLRQNCLLLAELLFGISEAVWRKGLESYESLMQFFFKALEAVGFILCQLYSRLFIAAKSGINSLSYLQGLFSTKLLEYSAALYDTFSCAAEFLWQNITIIYSKMLSLPEFLYHSIYSTVATVWYFITETTQQIGAVFESLAEFIILPFSLKNIERFVTSVFDLSKSIVQIPFSTASFVANGAFEIAKDIKDEVSNFIQFIARFYEYISAITVWLVIVIAIFMTLMSVFLFVSYLLRETCLLRALLNSGRNIQRYLYHVEEENRIEPNTERPRDQRATVHQVAHQSQAPMEELNPEPTVQSTSFIEDEKTLCIICQDAEKTIVLLPCKHLCVCNDCGERLFQSVGRKRDCPLCRKRIEHIMKVYV